VVRIRLETDGGFAVFPGLNTPVEVDTSQLPPPDAAEFERLVEAAHFFDQPAVTPAPRGAADYRQYTLTVEHDGRSQTVQVAEPVADPALRQLVARLAARRH
jgi:hypothetical protein